MEAAAKLGGVVNPQPVDNSTVPLEAGRSGQRLLGWVLAGVGVAGLVVATALYPSAARSAASQDWTPFVLVAGLLLIGLVADDDGLFAAAGHRLAAHGAERFGPLRWGRSPSWAW